MKSLTKHLSVLALVPLLTAGTALAKTVDTTAQEKDMRIMRGILESSLKEAGEDFPGRPTIKTTYLADQGYPVNLVEVGPELGGHAGQLRQTWRGENVTGFWKTSLPGLMTAPK